MNDVDYRARELKRLACSAKKNARYRHRGCSLPSDGLTPAQWRKKNGPVIVVQKGDKNERG
jgi:hypothetical protein